MRTDANIASDNERVAFRTCPLCEAGCGLAITVKDNEVTHIRGDMQDVFSKGFICPKGSTLKQLHYDADRLLTPLIKRNGVHVPATWQEAWQAIETGLSGVIKKYGRESIGTYLGNPGAHNLSSMTFNRVLLQAIGSRQRFSASTVDQIPKQVSSGMMFGSVSSVPVPDLDRTQYLLILGANPYESNGSLCTAPDFPGRLEAMQARGGKLVVVDPRKSRTAEQADEWLAIRPGTDALLLAAIANTLASDGLDVLEHRLHNYLNGLSEVVAALAFSHLKQLLHLRVSTRPRSVASPENCETRVHRRFMGELAPVRQRSARPHLGLWMSSIFSPAILTGSVGQCFRCQLLEVETPIQPRAEAKVFASAGAIRG